MTRHGRRLAPLLLLVALSAVAAPAAPRPPKAVEGRVVRVVDGGSVVFTAAAADAPEQRLLLAGVVAPMPCQPWGAESRNALQALVANKPVLATVAGRADAAGVLPALLTVDGVDVGRRLVEDGNAWSGIGRNGHGAYLKQERQAAALQRGMHATGNAQRPEDYRRSRGGC